MKNSSPNPPAHLGRESRRLWRSLVQEYRIQDAAGLALLGQACESLDRVRECQRQIGEESVVLDRFGQKKPHPLLGAERDARASMLAAMRALNLDLEPLRDGPGRPPGT